jgi:hypothetical protein
LNRNVSSLMLNLRVLLAERSQRLNDQTSNDKPKPPLAEQREQIVLRLFRGFLPREIPT